MDPQNCDLKKDSSPGLSPQERQELYQNPFLGASLHFTLNPLEKA